MPTLPDELNGKCSGCLKYGFNSIMVAYFFFGFAAVFFALAAGAFFSFVVFCPRKVFDFFDGS
jgi:hypothetical protein